MQDVKSDLLNLLRRNPEELIQELIKIGDFDSKIKEVIYLLSGQFQDLKEKRIKGILTFEQEIIEQNKIRNNLFEVLQDMDLDTIKQYQLRESIFNRIIIICRDDSRINFMTNLFPEKFYKNVKVLLKEEFSLIPKEETSLIIYDNFPSDMHSRKIGPFLQSVLDNDSIKYILYFGPSPIPELNRKYSNKVYSSNSKFSIHSRLNEMLLFLKYTNN